MTATRYFTVDSVVQQVQPAASTAAAATTASTTAADSSGAATPSPGRGGIVQVEAGDNRDSDQTVTATAPPPSPLRSPTSVHHLPVSTEMHAASWCVTLTLVTYEGPIVKAPENSNILYPILNNYVVLKTCKVTTVLLLKLSRLL